MWKSVSTEYLRRCGIIVRNEWLANSFTTLSDAELVEKVIGWLCRAIKYHLGYEGNYARIGHDGREWDYNIFRVFRYRGFHRRTAYAREHAIVHIIRQYYNKADKVLRNLLKEDYDEWKKLPNHEAIPADVVL
jgi:hypothetical protein